MNIPKKPFVLWLTGLSGAGKTTLGREVYRLFKPSIPGLAFIDGDAFREIVGDDLGHDPKARLENAFRLCRFCRYLRSQDISVICATMSLYPEVWAWNRENIKGYVEIYLKVEKDVLASRDPKGIYARALAGEEKNVVGVDLPFEEPTASDLILENNDSSEKAIKKRAALLCEFLAG